jgi:ABC-type nitrate/sulfonate/bicarbonate transport system substrate-binding protein
VPFIFWGGDTATFLANGGLETNPDSLFGKHGLKVKLTPGDDFDKQVDAYLANKTPFLRGTLSMLGQVSEKLTAKPETTPVVFLQLTWSAGDHLVGREGIKRIDQLKGKKIALQERGPHVGMLNDILNTAGLTWNDITVVWTPEVSGEKGPAELFRKDASITACFAISPEMFELTSAPESGGVDAVGDGTKKSVKGAHVVVSTQHMSRSIADVYACRKDFYDTNKGWLERFAEGYLKACEDLLDAKKKKENKDKDGEARYSKVIKMAQDIWGKDPAFKDSVAKEDDVDGLISDSVFVGVPGNESFFKGKGNLSGFDFKQKQALRLPADPAKDALKNNPKLFQAADLDYVRIRRVGQLHGKEIKQARISAEAKVEPEQTIYSFKIAFQPDKSDFSAAEYQAAFQRALELASLYGNTVVVIRGHADPSVLATHALEAAADRGILRRSGRDSYVWASDNKPFNSGSIHEILALIDKYPNLERHTPEGQFNATISKQMLTQLSEKRADEVRKTIISYAQQHGLVLDESQFRSQGVGVTEPFQLNLQGMHAPNRRGEFSIIKVPLKDVNTDAFDL